MSLIQWFADEYFLTVHKNDNQCQRKEQAFCEIGEKKQNRILCSRYAELRNVRNCEMGPPYPCGRESDLLVETNSGERLNCEIKGMYKTWFNKNRRPDPAYLWSPFQNPSKDDSAAFDLAKLATLSEPKITHIALIIIGSSLPPDHMDRDVDKFAEMAHIDLAPWESYRDYWPNQWFDGYYYDLRVWGCDLKSVPGWWATIADVFHPDYVLRSSLA
jgi:hypothetical protein